MQWKTETLKTNNIQNIRLLIQICTYFQINQLNNPKRPPARMESGAGRFKYPTQAKAVTAIEV